MTAALHPTSVAEIPTGPDSGPTRAYPIGMIDVVAAYPHAVPRAFLRRSASTGYVLEDLGVLGYRDGVRSGVPRPANEFLPASAPVHLTVAQPESVAVPARQHAVITPERLPILSWALVDAIMLSKVVGVHRRREAIV